MNHFYVLFVFTGNFCILFVKIHQLIKENNCVIYIIDSKNVAFSRVVPCTDRYTEDEVIRDLT